MRRHNDQITLRVTGTLRAVLEDEAATEARGLSSLIRKILIDHASSRVVERASAAATAIAVYASVNGIPV